MVCEKTFKEFLQVFREERSPQKMAIFASNVSEKKKLKESLLVHTQCRTGSVQCLRLYVT